MAMLALQSQRGKATINSTSSSNMAANRQYHSSLNVTKNPSESKQISFANTLIENNKDVNSSLHDTTPGLRPAEISIDEHDEDLHQVPTY